MNRLLLLSLLLVPLWTWAAAPIVDDEEDFESGDNGLIGNEDSDRPGPVSLSPVKYAGTGCPQGSVTAVLSGDGMTLSLIFDQYVSQAGGGTGQLRDLKKCDLIVPINVPEGFRAGVVRLDYRGFNLIPELGQVGLRVIYSTPKANGKKFIRRKVFKGPMQSEYFLSTKMRGKEVWNHCGKDFELHINTALAVETNTKLSEAFGTVDSIDKTPREARYFLRWKKCAKLVRDKEH